MIGLIDFGNKSIDHFGRTTEPKKLTEHNAWQKDIWDWDSNYQNRFYIYYVTQ